ncbi:MAG: hypothetical protein ACYCU0_15005, partial [Solirubrobacteraceae bacterium]
VYFAGGRDPLKAMLAADGYALAASASEDGRTLRLEIDATADACDECLAPAPVIASVARSCLADASISEDLEIDVRMPDEPSA